jgi:hypothetical protein
VSETGASTVGVRTYQGGCHCGKVRYQITAELKGVASCNCSICSKRGWLLTFVTGDEFTLLSGADAVTEYQFNKHKVHHLFCATCGVASFGHGVRPSDGAKTYSINARCLDGVDVSTLPVRYFDGRSL